LHLIFKAILSELSCFEQISFRLRELGGFEI